MAPRMDDIPRKTHPAPQERVRKGSVKSVTRDAVITLVLAGIAVGVLGASSWSIFTPPSSTQDKVHPTVVSQIVSRHIINSETLGTGKNPLVSYSYRGEKIPDKLSPDEIIEKRTETGYVKQLGKDADGKYKYQAILYPSPQFVHETDGWYHLQYATASKIDFDAAQKQSPLSFLFSTHIAYASNYYPIARGDGTVTNYGQGTWAAAQGNASGTSAATTTITLWVESTVICFSIKDGCSNTYTVTRAFLPFTTSAIPTGASITSASLNLYATSTVPGNSATFDADNDGLDYVTVVQTSQSQSNDVENPDFSLIAATEGIASGSRTDITSISADTWYSYPLNATGIGWIKKSGQTSNCGVSTGITCIGLREGHDIQNTAPVTAVSLGTIGTGVYFASADYTANSSAWVPYLSVNFAGTFAPWQFWDF